MIIAVFFSTSVFAWGPEGHGTIGILAIDRLQPEVRLKLEGIMESLDDQTIIEACNWPDEVRKTGKWDWSAPFHYINIPQGEHDYIKSRDCPDEACATEALQHYAIVLGTEQTHPEVRQQAFNWVCHLTGDLHQPLHAGYASDRGGNDFMIQFGQEPMNLHAYWDHALINSHFESREGLLHHMRSFPYVQADDSWKFAMVDDWTNESHKLVEEVIYPVHPVIDMEYEQMSWAITQQQLNTASSRLASIIDTVLKSSH